MLCGRSWGSHNSTNCPDGTYDGWRSPTYRGFGIPVGNLVPEPEVDHGKPADWPDTELHHALAEGLNILAGKLYKAGGRKDVLVSVTRDGDTVRGMGIDEGCTVMTATGPVKVASAAPAARSVFAGIALTQPALRSADAFAIGARIEQATAEPGTCDDATLRYWFSDDLCWTNVFGESYNGPCECGSLGCGTQSRPPIRVSGVSRPSRIRRNAANLRRERRAAARYRAGLTPPASTSP